MQIPNSSLLKKQNKELREAKEKAIEQLDEWLSCHFDESDAFEKFFKAEKFIEDTILETSIKNISNFI